MPEIDPSSLTVDYHRVSSNHYAIPSYTSIDTFSFFSLLIYSILEIIRALPSAQDNACIVLLLAHNIGGLLFHIPLLMLFVTHLRNDEDSSMDDPSFYGKLLVI